MLKIISCSFFVFLMSCGGGGSSGASGSQQQNTQPAVVTFKNVPESLSMIE